MKVLNIIKLFLFTLIFASCHSSIYQEVNSSELEINTNWSLLNLKEPVTAKYSFTNLCLEIINGYKKDRENWGLKTLDNKPILPEVILVNENEQEVELKERHFLHNQKDFICFASSEQLDSNHSYKQIKLRSNEPFKTCSIVWTSDNK